MQLHILLLILYSICMHTYYFRATKNGEYLLSKTSQQNESKCIKFMNIDKHFVVNNILGIAICNLVTK